MLILRTLDGQLGSNNVAAGCIRKTRSLGTRFAQQSATCHSLRYDLSAPPQTSQIFVTYYKLPLTSHTKNHRVWHRA